MESEALNTVNAKEGDRVLIKIPATSLFRISFILYMLPVIFLALGIVAGMKLAPGLSMDPQVGALVAGILGLGVSAVIIMFFSKQVRNNKDYMPEAIRIIKG
jgi:positive regulator of sigma E activity